MRLLLLPFVIFPIIELIVLIKVGSAIGALPTIGLLLLTAVVGVSLLRYQGLATVLRANQRIQSGEVPAREVAEGFLLGVGGVLLIIPGFVSDAIGLFCLLPGSRHWIVSRMLKRMSVRGNAAFFGAGFGPRRGPDSPADGVIIDGEFNQERDPNQGQNRHIGNRIDGDDDGPGQNGGKD